MREAWYIRSATGVEEVGPWAQDCALRAGWSAPEARRLGDCARRSARQTFERVYRRSPKAGMLISLDVEADGVCLELIHEGGASRIEPDALVAEVQTEAIRDRQAEVIQLRCYR